MWLLILGIVCCTFVFATNPPVTVTVQSDIVTHEANKFYLGCHSDSGYTNQPLGFYSQMIFGESFELGPSVSNTKLSIGSKIPIDGFFQLTPSVSNTIHVRHCNFQLYATPGGGEEDWIFKVVSALNKAADAVSFQSTNYQKLYITSSGINTKGVEIGRLGIANPSNDPDAASFKYLPGLSDASKFSFTSMSQTFFGHYIALNGNLSGSCSHQYHSPSSDVVLTEAPDKTSATFTLSKQPNPYAYQPWLNVTTPTATAHMSFVTGGFHSKTAAQVSYVSGTGLAGYVNRGIGWEGLVFQGGKKYEGYFFAKGDVAVTIIVQLQDRTTNAVLASSKLSFEGGDWRMLNFSLTSSSNTNCVDGSLAPDVHCGKNGPHSHICVKCAGQFFIGLDSPGSVIIDYVFMQPGTWGRLNDLPVLASGASNLKKLGITLIRQGGSFAKPSMYFWKLWRGKPWERPSSGWEWGKSLVSGWGPFEFIDMCEALGIEPVMTTAAENSDCCKPDDMADLVEYCWGDANTKWGKQRIQDGHPSPYKVRIFELGNEQYNTLYPAQVSAMEERAVSLGMGKQLYYMNPNNGHWLKSTDSDAVEALSLGDHVTSDMHVGGGGGVQKAIGIFNTFSNYTMGACNAETNAGIHTVQRMLYEASDLNDWLNKYLPSTTGDKRSRLLFRSASFCTERSGHFDAWDQGISFFLPNMTWLQPPGYVHQMISDTWQPLALNVTLNPNTDPGYRAKYSVSAAKSEDGSKLVVRYVNADSAPQVVTFQVGDMLIENAFQISNSDLQGANPPGNPTAIAPKEIKGKANSPFTVPGYSFTVIVFDNPSFKFRI